MAREEAMDCAEAEQASSFEVRASLARMGISCARETSLLPLTGGVSSRILLVDTGTERFCYKQALAKLNVADDWFAPVDRNRSEVDWIREANRILPGIAPGILSVDEQAMAFAMEYVDVEEHPIWKAQLLNGSATAVPAAAAGQALAALHSATARQPYIASRFANDEQFHALRIEPFFLAVARRHAELAERVTEVATHLGDTRMVLVHGDFSPKNILIGGKRGVVVLDAECATYGDPAFDYAFCLSHLLLKAKAFRPFRKTISAAVIAFDEAYRQGVGWEPIDALARRALAILPILMLARVDGKSPVNYLSEQDQAATRAFASDRIRKSGTSDDLRAFLGDWAGAAA